MKIHEYQAKELLSAYQIPVPRGKVVTTAEEAYEAAKSGQCGEGNHGWVVKAQIHAGGRGKAGGVQLAADPQAVKTHAQRLLGSSLVTPQTGPAGRKVRMVLVEEGCAIASEHYVSFLVDRASGQVVAIASAEGGGDIEEIAAARPTSIHREFIEPMLGLQTYQARCLSYALAIPAPQIGATVQLLQRLYRFFVEQDGALLEINPLVVTKEGQVQALDGKIIFDENALFRHKELLTLRDPHEEDEREQEAAAQDLSYVAMVGDIGCMVNGAGLAMATMDILHGFGGQPANFLDVGGGATVERIAAAFRILMGDPQVKVVFINIFGGIVRCDILAEGIVAAAAQVPRLCPLVVRLEGTRAAEGLSMLSQTQLPITTATTMDEGARLAVQIVQREGGAQA